MASPVFDPTAVTAAGLISFAILAGVYLRASRREQVNIFAVIFGRRRTKLTTAEKAAIALAIALWLGVAYTTT